MFVSFKAQRYKIIYNLQNLRCTICVFLLVGYRRALDCQEGRKDTQRDTLSGKTITEIPEYDSGLMDKEKIKHSTWLRQ